AAGAQLTRLDALATIRGGKHLTLHIGYDHLSAFAIEMWLTRLLADRVNHIAGSVENNLIVQRTARDEVRGDADLSFGKASIYAEGRFRRRALVTLSDDPQFQGVNGQLITPGIAYDATLGVRDRGSLAGIRAGLWAMYLSDYRSRSALVGVDLGRSFLDERLTFDLSFVYAGTNDTLANNPNFPTVGCNSLIAVTNVAQVNQGCYGTRAGAQYETGLTVSTAPSNHWFFFIDYRLVADTTGGIIAAASPAASPPLVALPEPTILTHVLLLRMEARY
ncbi:MAG: hypothetical protein JWM53_5141, partial [bacterium]|nr:hypothetical protein [bacterium]